MSYVMYEKNNKEGDYSSVLDHIFVEREDPCDINQDFDIMRGDYSVIKEHLNLLPEEVQKALEFLFCKPKLVNKDRQFLYKILKGIKKATTIKGQLKLILNRIISPSTSNKLPLSYFSLNGGLNRIQEMRKKHIPIKYEEEGIGVDVVFQKHRKSFCKKIEE